MVNLKIVTGLRGPETYIGSIRRSIGIGGICPHIIRGGRDKAGQGTGEGTGAGTIGSVRRSDIRSRSYRTPANTA